MSKSLAYDLRAYLYNTADTRETTDTQKVLSLVSPELQGKVFFEWFGEWILQVTYIADGSPPFVVEVARALNIQVYAPREHINQRRTLFALDRGIHGCIFDREMGFDELVGRQTPNLGRYVLEVSRRDSKAVLGCMDSDFRK